MHPNRTMWGTHVMENVEQTGYQLKTFITIMCSFFPTTLNRIRFKVSLQLLLVN